MPKYLRLFFKITVILFALIGFVLVAGYTAMKLKLTSTSGVMDTESVHFVKPTEEKKVYTSFPLAHTPEWNAFKQAVAKDKPIIDKISKETGVPPRILISILVPEQMRLFHTDRPIFKKVFEPLKVLGSQSQFSWGIFGIKDETARAVEEHLLNTKSPFYPGKAFEKTLAFKTEDIDQERFQRIIDEHNHTYSYLYTAMFVKEIESQWEKAGNPINNKPEIIATLWNLGFEKSKPNNNPKSGGAAIDLSGTTYSFGALAGAFYYSDELIELFP
jgi:hypothetical protein